MDDNNKRQQAADNDMPSTAEIKRSLISICSCTLAGLAASYIFDWNIWWSLGIGAFIGWALPGFLDGAREELSTLNEDDNDKKQTD